MKKHALLIVDGKVSYKEQMRLASMLLDTNKYRISILFWGRNYFRLADDCQKWIDVGVKDYVLLPIRKYNPKKEPSKFFFFIMFLLLPCFVLRQNILHYEARKKRSWFDLIFSNRNLAYRYVRKEINRKFSPFFNGVVEAFRRGYSLAFYYLYVYSKYFQLFKENIASISPDIVVLTEANVEFQSESMIKAAHDCGVPAIVVPYTIATALEPAEAYYHDRAYHVGWIAKFLVEYFRPQWIYRHKGRSMIRIPLPRLIALEFLNLAPPKPWILNSGSQEAIAVESQRMYEHYVRQGLPESQLVTVGPIAYDTMAEVMDRAAAERKKLYNNLGFPVERRMCLFAVMPDMLPTGRPDCEFQTYDEIINFIISTITTFQDWNVVVALHPILDRAKFEEYETDQVRIADGDVSRLIPLTDLYVASISATIRLAIACGKPVLNYDVYRFHYSDYDNVGGVLTVYDQAEFRREFGRISASQSAFDELKSKQEMESANWGVIDGKSSERILTLFDELIEAGKV